MANLAGKVALVTGASSGMGAAIAKELVRKGMQVVGLARRVERIEEIKNDLKGEKGELFPYKGDVSLTSDVQEVFQWIEIQFGTLHVLVNNAGIYRNGIFTELSMEHMTDVINVNFVSVMHCSKTAIDLMIRTEQNEGSIINITSVAGLSVPNYPAINIYPATKHAVTALSETLRITLRHLKSNIKVSNICPGVVSTEIGEASAMAVQGSIPESVSNRYENVPHLDVQDIADAVVFILTRPAHVQVQDVVLRPTGDIF